MLRSYFLLLLFLIITVLASGCNYLKPAASEEIVIKMAGSTSMLPISEKLAKHYEKKNPGKYVKVQGGDSTIGMRGVVNGIVDIGALSRNLTADEVERFDSYVITTDKLSIIVNTSNTIEKININQLRGIFSGKIINWKQLGGPDHDISVIVREEGSGTHIVFKDLVMERIKHTKKAAVVPSTGAVKAAVARDKYAIGYISSSYLSKEVKPLLVKDGEKESYSLVRPLIYITKKQVNSHIKAFLEFADGVKGQKIIKGL